jgi:hypothetical protein
MQAQTVCRCREGWICEVHLWRPWPHDACSGPGMRCANPDCPYWKGESPSALRPPGWQSIAQSDASRPAGDWRTLWRVQASSGRVWECALYRLPHGDELRLQPEGKEDAAVRTQLIRRAEEIGVLSESWRASVIAKGFKGLPARGRFRRLVPHRPQWCLHVTNRTRLSVPICKVSACA